MPLIHIEGVEVENLRGYSNAQLDFGDFCVLVGENNEGKSSALKLIDFLINRASKEFLDGSRKMTKDEDAFWMPANESRHRARRLTLLLSFSDGRRARRFDPDRFGTVRLRASIAKTDGKCRLNVGFPQRGEKHDIRAWDLLELLRQNVELVLIPAVRDASSSRFAKALRLQVDEKVSTKLRHSKQGGAPQEYRRALDAIRKLEMIVSDNRASLAVGEGMTLLQRMVRDSEVRFEADAEDVIEWIHRGLHLALSTGDHDVLKVRPTEVGNGLQSILDIAMTIGQYSANTDKQLMLIIEEPEVFLHPAAQRELIIGLKKASVQKKQQIVITTHSPIVIDECTFDETVLVREQAFYCPEVTDERRSAINTSLLASPHAESFFADTVLLVEGPGDKAFFDAILRRLRWLDEGAGLAKLVVQAVGSKTRFAPWINLFKAYGPENDRPIQWLCVMDGDAAANEDGHRAILRALRDGGYTIPQPVEQAIVEFGDTSYSAPDDRARKVAALNNDLASRHSYLFAIDLEWALLDATDKHGQNVIRDVLSEEGVDGLTTKEELAKKLGSKVTNGKVARSAIKAPHLRAMIGQRMPFGSISSEIESVLKMAISLVLSTKRATTIWGEAVGENPQG